MIKELENVNGTETIGSECMRALVYNKFRWEEYSNENKQVPIPKEIESTQTMTLSPVKILREEFEGLVKTEHSQAAREDSTTLTMKHGPQASTIRRVWKGRLDILPTVKERGKENEDSVSDKQN